MSVLRLTEEQVKARKTRLLSHCKPIQATTPLPKPQKAPQRSLKRSGGVSEGEACLAFQLVGIKGWEREYRFCPPRRWRFDFAFPAQRLGIEVEGGQWTQGRHVRGKGFAADMEKYNAATMGNWAVLRFTTDQAKNGYAYQTVMEFLGRAD